MPQSPIPFDDTFTGQHLWRKKYVECKCWNCIQRKENLGKEGDKNGEMKGIGKEMVERK